MRSWTWGAASCVTATTQCPRWPRWAGLQLSCCCDGVWQWLLLPWRIASCRCHSVLGMHAFAQVIQDVQALSCGVSGGYKQLRTLNQALIVYILVQTRLQRCDSQCVPGQQHVPGMPLVEPQPGMSECPCCWRTCEAACCDACWGLRRFKRSARAQRGQEPLMSNSPFMSEATMAAAQSRRPVGCCCSSLFRLQGSGCVSSRSKQV